MKKLIFLSVVLAFFFNVVQAQYVMPDVEIRYSMKLNGRKVKSISNDATGTSRKDSALITEAAAKAYADLVAGSGGPGGSDPAKLNVSDTAAMQFLYAAQIVRNKDSISLRKRHKDSVNIATSDYTTLYKNSQNAKYADTASGYTGDLYMAVYSSSNTYLWSPFLQYASTWSNNYDGFDNPEFNLSAYYNTMYRTENPSQLISINKRGGFPNKPDTVFYKLRTAAFGTGTFFIKPYSRLVTSRPYPNQRFVLHDNYTGTDTDISSMFQNFYGASTSGTDQTAAGSASPGYSFTTNSGIAGTTGDRFYMLVYPAVSTIATPYQIALAGGGIGGSDPLKLNVSDTAAMLALKLKVSDTAALLESKASAVNRAVGKQDTLSNYSVTAGTYTNITVNGKGLATAANNGVIQTYTTGSGINVNDPTTWVNVNPSNGVSQLNIVLPKNPVNGQRVDINFGGNISSQDSTLVYTLFMQGPIIGTKNFTGLTVDDQLAFRYNSATLKWYRVNDIAPRTTSTPPTISDALVWLDGTIIQSGGNYYFKDQSGNGRNFLITGYDFDSSLVKGFPYKSSATISAPAGDAILQAADLNSYLYTSGTANQIPVVSLFQDVDYEHKFFTRHKAQVVDSNDVEVYEPRIMDIVFYNTVKTGSNLTACQTYFNVPAEITSNVIWVSKAGNDGTGTGTKAAPYLTIGLYTEYGASGKTVYVKSGNYLENGGHSTLWFASSQSVVALGLCTVTAASTSNVVNFVTGSSSMTGFIIDATNTANYCFQVTSTGTKVLGLNKCYLKNFKTTSINGGVAVETTTLTNCVVVGQLTVTYATQDTKVSSPLINGCYFKNTRISLSNLDCIFKNNKIIDNDKASTIIPVAIGLIMYGNNITYNSALLAITTYVSAKTFSIKYNKLYPQSASGALGATFDLSGTVNVYIKNNLFKSTVAGSSGTGYFISSRVNSGYINEIDSNSLISKTTRSYYHIYATGTGTKIRNNYSWSNSLTDSHITLGAETLIPNVSNNSEIIGNTVIGYKLDYPAASGSTHCIFPNGGTNIKVAYNNISYSGVGIVVKTGTQQTYTSEGVYGNIIKDCTRAIAVGGVVGLKIYNNTIVHSSATYASTFLHGISVIENPTLSGSYSQNCLLKNNIIISETSATGSLVQFDAHAAENGCIAQNNVLNGGQYLLQDGTNYTSLATAQASSKLLNCVVQNPNLLSSFIPATAIVIGENLGAAYQPGLDILTNWGDEFIYPIIINRNQVSSGIWQVGAFIQ